MHLYICACVCGQLYAQTPEGMKGCSSPMQTSSIRLGFIFVRVRRASNRVHNSVSGYSSLSPLQHKHKHKQIPIKTHTHTHTRTHTHTQRERERERERERSNDKDKDKDKDREAIRRRYHNKRQ